MATEVPDLQFKILLIGDCGVGKTCIMLRFSDDANLSLEGVDFRSKIIYLRGKKIKLETCDTVGSADQEKQTKTSFHYKGAKGIILVYDITDAKTFDNITKWLENVAEHAEKDVEMMIVGNKCDMDSERVVSKESGEAFAKQRGIRFQETSAEANINLDAAIMQLVEAILDKIPKEGPTDNPDNVNNKGNGSSSESVCKCCVLV